MICFSNYISRWPQFFISDNDAHTCLEFMHNIWKKFNGDDFLTLISIKPRPASLMYLFLCTIVGKKRFCYGIQIQESAETLFLETLYTRIFWRVYISLVPYSSYLHILYIKLLVYAVIMNVLMEFESCVGSHCEWYPCWLFLIFMTRDKLVVIRNVNTLLKVRRKWTILKFQFQAYIYVPETMKLNLLNSDMCIIYIFIDIRHI